MPNRVRPHPGILNRTHWLALILSVHPAGSSTGTASQSLAATIRPAGSISAPALAALRTTAANFQPFTGTLSLNYRVRTTPSGGGNVTLRVTSDFTPSGGPSVAAGALSYTCTGATLGVACIGTQPASTAVQTPVVTLPASACAGGSGGCSQYTNSVILNFSLADDPGYQTGTYSARVMFTISAT
ncbi:MAG TPA: hypothetical protein VMT86_06465 [Bryobacteraceae bacterium]|nr:hypothetical protein [Bryobacteraceae bacterium]